MKNKWILRNRQRKNAPYVVTFELIGGSVGFNGTVNINNVMGKSTPTPAGLFVSSDSVMFKNFIHSINRVGKTSIDAMMWIWTTEWMTGYVAVVETHTFLGLNILDYSKDPDWLKIAVDPAKFQSKYLKLV